ncbi:acyl-CoA N-acyltransferase [Linnemannia elongata]|nr:acyl-CoA N-acyltransferase [Linnemannia elongata]
MTQQEEKAPAPRNKDNKCSGPFQISDNPPHYLSAVEYTDIPEMVRVLNLDKDIYNGTASFQYPYLESHARTRLENTFIRDNQSGYTNCWAMRSTPDGPLIGWIHAHFLPEDSGTRVHPETGRELKVGVIGYWVSPEHTGKGHGSRAARWVVQEYLFKKRGCDIVRAEAYTHNVPSRKVLEAAGMECEVKEWTVFIPKLQKEMVICCYAIHRDGATRSVVTDKTRDP